MKVFRIGDGEVTLINEALDILEESYDGLLKDELEPEEEAGIHYDLAHVRATKSLLKDMRLQELCEVCLSYFWDRFSEEGVDNPDAEYVIDAMGIDECELRMLFKEAGYDDN